MKYYLDTSTLSLLPAHPRASLNPGVDVLKKWPHEYDSDGDNAQWVNAFDWRGTKGYHQGVKSDCAYEPFAFNYAFCALFDYIPAGFKNNEVTFAADTTAQRVTKAENFYAMHQFITHYPTYSRMGTALGMSDTRFVQQVVPCIYNVAANINFLDLNLRLWEYNHTEAFPLRVTTTTDGAPIEVCCPQNRFLQRALNSGKYKTYCVKFDYAVGLASGMPVDYAGLHIGTRHDSRTFKENKELREKIMDWEWW